MRKMIKHWKNHFFDLNGLVDSLEDGIAPV